MAAWPIVVVRGCIHGEFAPLDLMGATGAPRVPSLIKERGGIVWVAFVILKAAYDRPGSASIGRTMTVA